jgi:hypothetical protein
MFRRQNFIQNPGYAFMRLMLHMLLLASALSVTAYASHPGEVDGRLQRKEFVQGYRSIEIVATANGNRLDNVCFSGGRHRNGARWDLT